METSSLPTGAPDPAAAPELYPGEAADRQRQADRHAALAEAAGTPLPGPLLAAFTAPEMKTLGVTFRPVVHADHAILQQIGSPFLKNLIEMRKPEAARHQFISTPAEVWEFIYLFTVAPRQARALLAQGRQAFSEAAAQAIGDRFHDAIVLRLAAAAQTHYFASWATAIAYEPRAEPGGDGSVFTAPPPSQTTASAGGSTTSPG